MTGKPYTDAELRILADDLRGLQGANAARAAAAITQLLAERDRTVAAIEEIDPAVVADRWHTPAAAAEEMRALAVEAARSGGAAL